MMNKYGIVNARIRHFISSVKHLVRRCSESNGALRECLDVDAFLRNSYSTSYLEDNYDVHEQVDDEGEPGVTSHLVPESTGSSDWRNFTEKDIDVKLEEYVKRVVLSEETVMKIRLILLWTFNHNLLLSNPKNTRDNAVIEEGRSLEIGKDNLIPIQEILKYFPSTHFSSSLIKELGFNSTENVIKVVERGKYHYRFNLNMSYQTFFTSEAILPVLHDSLVRKMISLWQQSQSEYHFLPLPEKIPHPGRNIN